LAQTDLAIEAHEKALEDKEKRLRVVEVPLESDQAKFDKMEAKVIALTFPIKDIYAKIEELEQTNTKNQESLTTSLGEIDTRYDNLVFNIETKTD